MSDWQLIANKSYICRRTIEVKQKLLTPCYLLKKIATNLILMELPSKKISVKTPTPKENKK